MFVTTLVKLPHRPALFTVHTAIRFTDSQVAFLSSLLSALLSSFHITRRPPSILHHLSALRVPPFLARVLHSKTTTITQRCTFRYCHASLRVPRRTGVNWLSFIRWSHPSCCLAICKPVSCSVCHWLLSSIAVQCHDTFLGPSALPPPRY
jgi:hypothetical protein